MESCLSKHIVSTQKTCDYCKLCGILLTLLDNELFFIQLCSVVKIFI